MKLLLAVSAFVASVASLAPFAAAAAPLDGAEPARIAAIAQDAVAHGAPSVSIAVVRGEDIEDWAFGRRALSPDRPADVHAAYRIGSVSKQFTAAVVVMLAAEGKLSLDDKVGRWFPELSGADRITVREVLSHTAGYKGYFTIDYLIPEGKRPIEPQAIADRWGTKPLDFEPGSQYRYSNTDYVIAGRIVEKVTGRPLDDVIRERIFGPLHLASASFRPGVAMPEADAHGYSQFVLGPPRPADIVGAGWEFAAGEIVMTAQDLARWDLAMLDHRLLSDVEWTTLETPVPHADGKPARYGLGLVVDTTRGHRRIHHPGSTSGFTTENRIYPDDHAAIVVMVNADYGNDNNAPGIADRIEAALFPEITAETATEPAAPAAAPAKPPPLPSRPEEAALARRLFDQVRRGSVDASLLTSDAQSYFTPDVLADYRTSLEPLGDPTAFTLLKADVIDGLDATLYEIDWGPKKLIAVLRLTPERKVEAFTIFSVD